MGAEDIEALQGAGIETVAAVQLEAGDIDENEAANQLADLLLTPELTKSAAFTGRCNLIAQSDGVLCYEEETIHALNLLDETITLAALPNYSRVSKGQMIATVKIIPFAVAGSLLEKCKAGLQPASLVTLNPFKPMRVELIETELSGPNDKTSRKLRSVTEARIRSVGGSLSQHHHCHHSVNALKGALPALAGQADLILIAGASATTDRRDVIPTAVVAAGGEIDHFGMPVDPGNLLVLGHHGTTPIIGLPGCAKSPKLNGFDWVLERLACGLNVSATDIMRMGAGGLLKEIGSRPQPRSHATADTDTSGAPNIAAIVLAAGKSSRMQGANKLLADIDGKPMITHTIQQVMASAARPVIVVTGRDHDRVSEAVEGIGASVTHNPDFATGMASSLRAGVNALPEGIGGALICLGDMPLVTAEQMNTLIEAFDAVEGRGICVPTYQGKWGNPVLWASTYFDEIRAITGDKGARDLLHHHGDHVYEVSMEQDTILQDFDTPESLDALKT